ncbi:TPA: terminase small subunit [Escherichia coli]|nr:terminase small subunit [Escherichia coli]MCV5898179.1 terminase small subunit [Escherichia coli]HAZ7556112.1 terminase small subunit [Escherichia coli]
MALTDKQEMFCREYLIDLNATQAAIRAGYSAKTANRTASENLSKPDIKLRIAELKAQRNDLVGINAEYVLNRLIEIDQMDVLDILLQNGELVDILSTLFHQQSRKIGMIVPSVVISEKHTDMLEITEHPVEVGAAVADHAYKKPSEVVMEVGFAGGGALLDFASNLTATSLLGLSPQQTYQELLDLQESRIPFDVVTGKRLYSNMLIRALEVTTDKTTENVLSAVLTLREVLISRTQQITVADKTNMKEGASTSAVQNSGNKTTKPPDTSLLKSITGNVASLLGGG